MLTALVTAVALTTLVPAPACLSGQPQPEWGSLLLMESVELVRLECPRLAPPSQFLRQSERAASSGIVAGFGSYGRFKDALYGSYGSALTSMRRGELQEAIRTLRGIMRAMTLVAVSAKDPVDRVWALSGVETSATTLKSLERRLGRPVR